LSKAEKLDNYQEVLNQYAAYDLLAVDDFGLMNLDINKCRNLFEVFDSMDPHKSILVISQIPVASWYDMFLEHTYAEACLARLLSDAYRLEMNGRNMRNIHKIIIYAVYIVLYSFYSIIFQVQNKFPFTMFIT
jgi:DNA replication protein DnaC